MNPSRRGASESTRARQSGPSSKLVQFTTAKRHSGPDLWLSNPWRLEDQREPRGTEGTRPSTNTRAPTLGAGSRERHRKTWARCHLNLIAYRLERKTRTSQKPGSKIQTKEDSVLDKEKHVSPEA